MAAAWRGDHCYHRVRWPDLWFRNLSARPGNRAIFGDALRNADAPWRTPGGAGVDRKRSPGASIGMDTADPPL